MSRGQGTEKWSGANIPVSTGTGKWQIVKGIDEKGEETGDLELQLRGVGMYADGAAEEGTLSACLRLGSENENDSYFTLKENGKYTVRSHGSSMDTYNYVIEDKVGCRHSGDDVNCNHEGRFFFIGIFGEGIPMRSVLDKEGEATFFFRKDRG